MRNNNAAWYKLPNHTVLFNYAVSGEGVTVMVDVTVGEVKSALPREYWLWDLEDLYTYWR